MAQQQPPAAPDVMDIDVPMAEAGGISLDVVKAMLGDDGATRMLLASRVVTLEQENAQLRAQVAALKAKVRELDPKNAVKETAPAEPEAPSVVPTEPYRLKSAEELVGATNGAGAS